MKLKKSLWATASVIVLAYTTPVFTDDTDKVVNATGNMFMDTMNKTGIFEWISGGVGYTDKTLNWDITAFSNLSETKDTITYLQTSYNRQKSVNRLNLGLGYRRLIDTTATPLIVGVNAFFDSKDGTKNILAFKASDNFQRFSVGAELKTARFDMAANLYRRIGNNIIDDKKVLQGWDITAKGNIPNYEQVSVGVNTYRFDGVEDTVVRGNKLIAEFTPNAMITVRGTYDKPNGESAQTDISVDFKLAFDKSIQDQLKSVPISSTDAVWHKRYDKVERQYDIKTAEAQSTPTLGTAISSTDLAANNISDGDGQTEQSAYALQNGEHYDILKFAGTVDSSLSTDNIKVTVTKVSGDGVKGTDFQLYASDGTTVIALADVTADSKFEDKAGGREATLQFTFSADGFEDRVVFVKAEAINQIGSLLSDADKSSNNIKGGDGTSRANAYTLTNDKTYDISTFIGTVPSGVTPTVKAETITGTDGTDFQFYDTDGTSKLNVNGAKYGGKLEDVADKAAAVIKLTYSATDYENRSVYVKTDSTFTGTLTMADLVVPYASGTVTASTADILGKLSVSGSQTQKSDWTIKSLADTDNNTNLTVNGKTLTVSGTIGSPTTVTVVFEHPEYADQTKTFKLSTGAGVMSSGTRTGLSGKWGIGFSTAADYKLKLSDTVGDTTATFKDDGTTDDFTFTILPNSDGSKGGKTATTAGIVTGALSGAIDDKTGEIDASKLNKSGTLLVKIVRKVKSGLPALTDYENITVTKQDNSDHTGFSVSAGAIPWNANSQTVSYTENASKPAGIGTATYALTASGTTAGATTGGDAITVASSDGKIAKTTQSGVVKVRITYAANDKYAQMTRDVDVTVNKQTAGGTLKLADIIVLYIPGTSSNQTISTADILGKLSVDGGNSAKGDWTLKSLAKKDTIANTILQISGKTLIVKGEFTTSRTITATFESAKYGDKTADIEVSTRRSQLTTSTPTGTGKWGKSYTTTYNLDDEGGTFKTGTEGDFTFSIVPSGTTVSGYTATTANIFSSNPITASTGAIDASKLTRSGSLLIKIVRAKTGTPTVTEHYNLTVGKQVLGTDVTTPPAVAKATGENGAWKDSTGTKIDLDYALPGGTSATQYTWSAAGKTGDTPSGTLNIVNGDIRGATSGGTVEITMTATASNPKYSGSIRTADFTIAKQNLADLSTKPSVTASQADRVWKAGGAKLSGMAYNNVPGGSVAAFDWSVVGKTGDAPSGTLSLDTTDKKLKGAESGGTVVITMKAKANDKKYTGQVNLADFTIAKQNLADLSTKPSITASQADRVWKAGGAKLSGMAYQCARGQCGGV